ncbi:MAG: hypothetical protein H7Y04_07030 [Verrucomicrobia bacterium]|nr:hypothetical protein [Cytophagales bacterium]
MQTIPKMSIAFIIAFGFTTAVFGQEKSALKQVSIRFQNNSILFRHVTLVTYWSETATDNATEGVVLAPYFTTKKTYQVGTQVYFANHKQVDVVMSGKRLQGTPFMVVKAEDEGKTFKIFK